MSYSEAITKNDLKKILGNIGFGSLNDYVIEQGTSGIWTYRKWKSGVAECWGIYSGSITSRTANAPYNSSVFDIGTVDYPTGFFADIPNVNVNTRIGSFYNLTSYANSYQNNVSISITSNASGTQTVYAYIYAKGKWKNDIETYQGIGSIGAVLLDTFHPVGSYYETSDVNFNPNTAWGGTWVKETLAVLCTAENVTTRTKTFSISRARGSHADVTAPTVTDYTFVAWVATATQGWVGSVYPAQPTAQTATFWVSVSDGNTNSMNVNAVALYRKNDNSINRWHRTA